MADHKRRVAVGIVAGATALAAMAAASGRVAAEEPVKTPTFTRDVAPILQEKCQACHRPGYIAPMSLVTFEETRPWARRCV